MFRVLFFLFVIVPIIEIAVLMQVGALIGPWPTVAIVVVTAWLGAKNVKQQGLSTIQNLQNKMARGEEPSQEIVAGLLLLVAGVLLVTPGFVTDAFGLSLLVPQIRSALVKSVQQHIVMQSTASAGFTFTQHGTQQGFDQAPPSDSFEQAKHHVHQGQTIDGEFERKE